MLHSLLAPLLLSLLPASPAAGGADPIQVFILAGQSNMEGKAKLSLLEHQLTQTGTAKQFAHLRDDDGWTERDDVWIKFLYRCGNLTAGYGSPGCVGPELAFGHAVGDHFDEQVLIIKTAWGGKSLYRDFRPPGAGLPTDEVLEGDLERERKRHPERTLDEIKESYGHYYRLMLAEIQDTLSNAKTHFPDYRGQDFELAGFVWFQGWNDMVNSDYTAAYAENMVHFIRDVRRDLNAEGLPFVIGQLGVGGEGEQDKKREAFKAAQAAPSELEEFRGNVALVRTDAYWDTQAQAVFDKGWKEHLEEWNTVGSDRPYHYLGSHKTMAGIGGGFAQALLDLRAGE